MPCKIPETDRILRSRTLRSRTSVVARPSIELICRPDLLSLTRQHLKLRSIVALASCHRTLWHTNCLFIDLLRSMWQEAKTFQMGGREFMCLMGCINTFPTEVRLLIEWAVEFMDISVKDNWFSIPWNWFSTSEVNWITRLKGAEKAPCNYKFELAIKEGHLETAKWIYDCHSIAVNYLKEGTFEEIYKKGNFHILLWLIEHTNADSRETGMLVLRRRDENQLYEEEIGLWKLLQKTRERMQRTVEESDIIEKKHANSLHTIYEYTSEHEWTNRQKLAIIKAETLSVSAVSANGTRVKIMSRQEFKDEFLSDIHLLCLWENKKMDIQKTLDNTSASLEALRKLIELLKAA